MSEFIEFRTAIQRQFDMMAKNGNLFLSNVNKDDIWTNYLASFPEGTNPMFRERTTYDCQCCKSFVRSVGRVLGQDSQGNMVSVWDVTVSSYFQEVADKMKALNEGALIAGLFLHNEKEIGKSFNMEILEDGGEIQWDHYHQVLPKSIVVSNVAQLKGEAETNRKVLKRSLEEISQDSVDTVLELIDQNSIYRGSEHRGTIELLKRTQVEYNNTSNKDLYLWYKAVDLKGICSFRNTVIGSLLVDISNGIELEVAVKKFEDKVAPSNYKRTTALVTPRMKEQAKSKAQELGIEHSLVRRHATKQDISVSNVLFADQATKPFMEDSVFDVVKPQTKGSSKSFDKVQEVTIDKFLSDVLPKAETIELYLENKHESNLMSLVAPVNGSAPCIMKWGNNFSWSYKGEVADSMRERVRSAGGNVEGVLRFTHSWNHDGGNTSLMDLHCFLPNHGMIVPKGKEVHDSYGNQHRVGWNNRKHITSRGVQDVDYTSEAPRDFVPIENISFPDKRLLKDGEYTFKIHNWQKRTRNTSGGVAEIEFDGNVYTYDYSQLPLGHKEWLTLAVVTLENGEFSIDHKFNCEEHSREVYSIDTNNLHKVNMVMKSPNHWDGNKTGNEHTFFILDGCKNPDDVRGFYQEFLIEELKPHRKVFEVLASNLKASYSEDQLSGVGFSSTVNNSVLLKIGGTFNRMIKVTF